MISLTTTISGNRLSRLRIVKTSRREGPSVSIRAMPWQYRSQALSSKWSVMSHRPFPAIAVWLHPDRNLCGSIIDLGIDRWVKASCWSPDRTFLVDHTIEAARDGSSSPTSLAVALVLQFAAHVVVGLIEKSDETVDLSARLEAEPADSNKDILRCGILADVQPIKAGYWGKVQTC